MSGKATGFVWELNLSKSLRYVALAYADHADQNGEGMRPSYGLIAWKTDYSARHIRRLVGTLVDMGIFQIEKQAKGKPTSYKMNFESPLVRAKYTSRKAKKVGLPDVPPLKTAPNGSEDTQMSHQVGHPDVPPTQDTQMSHPVKPSVKPSVNRGTPIGVAQGAQDQAPPPFDSPGIQVEVPDELVQSYLAQHLQPSPVASGESHPLPSPLVSSLESPSSERSPKPNGKTPPRPPAPPREKKPRSPKQQEQDAMCNAILKAFHWTWETATRDEQGVVRETALQLREVNWQPEHVQNLYDECEAREWEHFSPKALLKVVSDVRPTLEVKKIEATSKADDSSTDWMFRAAELINMGGVLND